MGCDCGTPALRFFTPEIALYTPELSYGSSSFPSLNTSWGFGIEDPCSTLTSLIDGVFGNIGNVFSCVLWVRQQQ